MKFLIAIVSVLALITLSSNLSVDANGQFQDATGHQYEESINFLFDKGVVQGYSEIEFRPDQGINRAEVLKIVFLAAGIEELGGSECFSDVKDEWFAEYVCRAKDLEVVHGYPDGRFKPGDKVNVAEIFKIMSEVFDAPIRNLKADEAWFQPYVDFMHTNGFSSKYSIYPWRTATRAEVAFWAHQFMQIESGDLEVATVRDPGSNGCGERAPSTLPTEYWVDGQAREAIVEIPDDYDPNHAYSLIVAFHGRTNSNEDVKSYYRLNRVAGDEALIVYPAGIWTGSSFTWSNAGDSSDELRDYAFFDEIVKTMSDSYCVNEDEIYAVGHSLGAWFTNSLACARGDVLRAVGSLGGARSESVCTGPVAVMQWHNPNDRLAPFYTGQTARDNYIEQNLCSIETQVVEPSWGHCVEYKGCMDGAQTLWCPHTNDYADYSGEYYPHNWPTDTGKEIWAFFKGLKD